MPNRKRTTIKAPRPNVSPKMVSPMNPVIAVKNDNHSTMRGTGSRRLREPPEPWPRRTPLALRLNELGLRDNRPIDDAMDVSQAEVTAGVAIGQLFVVDAHQVQHGGVEVVDMHLVLGGR